MADATLSEMTNRVLQKLSLLAGGETPAAEDSALVQAGILAVNEKLRDLEIAYWTDEAFPLAIKEDLAAYVACHVAPELLPAAPELALAYQQRNEDRALANLRRLTASRERVDKPTRAVYY